MAKQLGLGHRFWTEENAATMAEYVLMIGFVALACVTALTTFGTSLASLFQRAVSGLS